MRRKKKRKYQNRKHHKVESPRHDWEDKKAAFAKAKKDKKEKARAARQTKVKGEVAVSKKEKVVLDIKEDDGTCDTCGSRDIYTSWPREYCLEHYAESKASTCFWRPLEVVKQEIIEKLRKEAK